MVHLDIDIGNSSEHNEIDRALAEVWARNLPSIRGQVGTVERAVRAVAGDGAGADVAAGRAAAHRLAGSLGSFGLARGSELARELERRLEAGGSPGDAREIAQLVAELREVIEG